MADIESVLADVSYMMALDKGSLNKRVSKKINLPDVFSVGAVEYKLNKPTNNFSIDYILSEKLGTLLMGRFVSESIDSSLVPLVNFYSQILNYNKQTLSVAQYAILCEMDEILNTKLVPENKYLKTSINSDEYMDKLQFFQIYIEEIATKKISQYTCQEHIHYNGKKTKSDINLTIGFDKGNRDEIKKLKNSNSKLEENVFVSDITSLEIGYRINSTPESSIKSNMTSTTTETHSVQLTSAGNDLESRRKIELKKFKDIIYDKFLSRIKKSFLSNKYFYVFLQWKAFLLLNKVTLCMDDFNIHRKIGRGGFGEVYGCHKMDTGKLLAMKILDKKRLKSKHCIRSALLEQKILAMCDCPFIVRICYCFQTHSKLVILLDLLDGGDLRYHASNTTAFSEEQVRFFSSEIYLGLEYMHKKNIIFRDLKPANILLETNGHVKISDFGLALLYDENKPPKSFAGTYGYMAPEIIKKEPYAFGVDWFSYGCLLFKLFKGSSPFHNYKDDSETIVENTLNQEPDCSGMPADLSELVQALLVKEQHNRIGGSTKMTYESVKKSNWFKNTDWVSYYLSHVDPPFVPPQGEINAENIYAIGNFDDAESKKVKLVEKDIEKFNKFNFFSEAAWEEELVDSVFNNVVNESLKDTKNYIIFRLYRKGVDTDMILYGYLLKETHIIFTFHQKKFVQLFIDRITIGPTPNVVKTIIKRESVVSVERSKNNAIIINLGDKNITFKTENPAEYHVWFMCLQKFINGESTFDLNKVGLKTGLVESRVQLTGKLSESES